MTTLLWILVVTVGVYVFVRCTETSIDTRDDD